MRYVTAGLLSPCRRLREQSFQSTESCPSKLAERVRAWSQLKEAYDQLPTASHQMPTGTEEDLTGVSEEPETESGDIATTT